MAPFPSDLKNETKSLEPLSFERKPMMLKDFLIYEANLSSSNGFLSFPRRSDTTVGKIIEMDINARYKNNSERLSRSRSKAAVATISALQRASEAVINAVKYLPFTISPSHPAQDRPKQGTLPRSFSRRLRRSFWRKSEESKREIDVVKITVKDIIRWRSFAECEIKRKSFDFPSPINTTTTTTTTATSSSSSSTWSETDSESDFLHSSSGSSEYSCENEVADGKKKSFLPEKSGVGEESVETATGYGKPKAEERQKLLDCPHDKDQLSPVSVLEFPYEDEESPSSSFQQSLANMERSKKQLLKKLRRFESLPQLDSINLEKRIADFDEEEEEDAEEKARNLLRLFKASTEENGKPNLDMLLLDFFSEGLAGCHPNLIWHGGAEGKRSEEDLLRAASRWTDGYGELSWRLEDNREAPVKEMEKGGNWRKFGEEEEELAVEMEIGVLSSLMEEVLLDLIS